MEAEGGEQGNVPHCQLFSRSVCACTPNRGSAEEMEERKGEKAGAGAEEGMIVVRPLWQSKGIVS